jgi:hypothetical protein
VNKLSIGVPSFKTWDEARQVIIQVGQRVSDYLSSQPPQTVFGNQRITEVADPVAPGDAVNLQTLRAMLSGMGRGSSESEKGYVGGGIGLKTTNVIPKVIFPGRLGNSAISDDGINVVISSRVVSIGTATSTYKLNVEGDLNISGTGFYRSQGVIYGNVTAVHLTGQTSAIGATNLLVETAMAPAGYYRIAGQLVCTTAGSGGSATLTINWTQHTLALAAAFAAVNLNATGYSIGSLPIIYTDGTAHITYTVAYTGTGSPQYALHIIMERIG